MTRFSARNPLKMIDEIFSDFPPSWLGMRDLLDNLPEVNTFPPVNLVKNGKDKEGNAYDYVLTFALAGYDKEDLSISVVDGLATIASTSKTSAPDEKVEYLYQGIAQRKFKSQFYIGEGVKVQKADMENGMLSIYINSNIEPNSVKTIPIN